MEQIKITKRGMSEGGIITDTQFHGDERVKGVQLSLEASTSTARAMNIAMKILAMNWQDHTIDEIEQTIDERLIELANGKNYQITVTLEKGKKTSYYEVATSEDRAKEIVLQKLARSNRKGEITEITQY